MYKVGGEDRVALGAVQHTRPPLGFLLPVVIHENPRILDSGCGNHPRVKCRRTKPHTRGLFYHAKSLFQERTLVPPSLPSCRIFLEFLSYVNIFIYSRPHIEQSGRVRRRAGRECRRTTRRDRCARTTRGESRTPPRSQVVSLRATILMHRATSIGGEPGGVMRTR